VQLTLVLEVRARFRKASGQPPARAAFRRMAHVALGPTNDEGGDPSQVGKYLSERSDRERRRWRRRNRVRVSLLRVFLGLEDQDWRPNAVHRLTDSGPERAVSMTLATPVTKAAASSKGTGTRKSLSL
jgi:hypothetical protein